MSHNEFNYHYLCAMITYNLDNLQRILDQMKVASLSDYTDLFKQLSDEQLSIFNFFNSAKHSRRNLPVFEENMRTTFKRLMAIERRTQQLREPYRELMHTCVEQLCGCLTTEFNLINYSPDTVMAEKEMPEDQEGIAGPMSA